MRSLVVKKRINHEGHEENEGKLNQKEHEKESLQKLGDLCG